MSLEAYSIPLLGFILLVAQYVHPALPMASTVDLDLTPYGYRLENRLGSLFEASEVAFLGEDRVIVCVSQAATETVMPDRTDLPELRSY